MSMLDDLLTKTVVTPDGTELPDRAKLQFKGAVSVVDSPTTGRTVVTITGSGGGPSELSGDVTGPSDATAVEAIRGVPVSPAPGTTGQVLTRDASGCGWADQAIPAASVVPFDPAGTGMAATKAQAAIVEASGILVDVTLDMPASGTLDPPAIYKAPACQHVQIFEIKATVVEKFTGAGTVTLTAGGSAGTVGYLIAQALTSASDDLVAGHTKSLATLGSRFPANAGYVAVMRENDEIRARLVASGAVSGGKLRVTVYGRVTR